TREWFASALLPVRNAMTSPEGDWPSLNTSPDTTRYSPDIRRLDEPVMMTLPLACAVRVIGLSAVPVPRKIISKSFQTPSARTMVSPGFALLAAWRYEA